MVYAYKYVFATSIIKGKRQSSRWYALEGFNGEFLGEPGGMKEVLDGNIILFQ